MFLAHMELFEVDSPKNTLTLVERTALQQRIKLYSLQTSSKDERVSMCGAREASEYDINCMD